MNTKHTTFWTLLEKNRLLIPRLQRDYAQGRTDPQTREIRENLASSFLAALTTDDKPLDLGLVYGSKIGNSIVLLDGQQRLSTLFLLHWYLARRGGVSLSGERFDGFSYETRTSARDFCRELVGRTITITPAKPISAQIKDMNWFRATWEGDPTVRGMLVMLDALHDRPWGGADFTALWQRLIAADKPAVSFHFVLLEKAFGTADEIYIRLNARGRQLTEFEKFKAWLEKHAKDSILVLHPLDWHNRLDKDWADLFWSHRIQSPDKQTEDTPNTDGPMLAFFRGVALNALLSSGDKIEQQDKLIQTITANGYLNEDQLRLLFTQETLQRVFDLLGLLSVRQLAHQEVLPSLGEARFDLFPHIDASKKIISGWQKVTYAERLILHGLCDFMLATPRSQVGEAKQHTNFIRWSRFVRNLVLNSDVSKPEQFANAARSLQRLSKLAAADVFNHLASIECSLEALTGLDKYQLAEEQRKARIVLNEPDVAWETAIREAEDHVVFQGQIGFLLDFSAGKQLEDFERYSRRARELFNYWQDNRDSQKFLFERALLTHGDYLGEEGKNFTFGKHAAEWKSILRTSARAVILQRLIDQLSGSSIEESLSVQIKNWQDNSDKAWRGDFIMCPEAIDECWERQCRFDDAEKRVLLLHTTSTGGYHAELCSFRLFKQCLKGHEMDFAPLVPDYYYQRTEAVLPFAVLKNPDTEAQRVRIKFIHDSVKHEDKPWRVALQFQDNRTVFDSLLPDWQREDSQESASNDHEWPNRYFKQCQTAAEALRLAKDVIPLLKTPA